MTTELLFSKAMDGSLRVKPLRKYPRVFRDEGRARVEFDGAWKHLAAACVGGLTALIALYILGLVYGQGGTLF